VRGFVCLCFDFDFDLLFVFIGACGDASAGWAGAASTLFGPSVAGVLLSSMIGFGDALTCCSGGASVFCGGGTVFVVSPAGSVSPPEATQAG
jgi:hypothetical protein